MVEAFPRPWTWTKTMRKHHAFRWDNFLPDEKLHLLIHAKETRHRRIWLKDFEILGKGYKSDFKRRISESLFIKKLKPDLNVQMDAYRLTLFNWSDDVSSTRTIHCLSCIVFNGYLTSKSSVISSFVIMTFCKLTLKYWKKISKWKHFSWLHS